MGRGNWASELFLEDGAEPLRKAELAEDRLDTPKSVRSVLLDDSSIGRPVSGHIRPSCLLRGREQGPVVSWLQTWGGLTSLAALSIQGCTRLDFLKCQERESGKMRH